MSARIKICLFITILFGKAQGQNVDESQVTVFNYEESKVPEYTLPDIFETLDGKMVKTVELWEKKRKLEILKLFEDNVYGQMPEAYDGISFEVTNQLADAMYGEGYKKNGKATLKEVKISVWKMSDTVILNLTLFIPNKAKQPVPAFLLINNRDKYNTDPTRFIKSQFWPAEMIIDSGYAVAAFHVNDAAPDDSKFYHEGVLKLYPEQLNADNGMKAIGAWAWAASRVMDYFEKDEAIDKEKIIIVGHSRGGKASLWAGAQDQRFALIVSNNSGNTGAALSRRMFGETVKRINTSFPHWFANNYAKYNDNENGLPIDQHMLISLIAPRPVYITNATEDLWADPKGTFLALKEAESVYALYNLESTLPDNLPPANTPFIRPPLGYHIREGRHNMTKYDWQNFIKFSDNYFKKNSGNKLDN